MNASRSLMLVGALAANQAQAAQVQRTIFVSSVVKPPPPPPSGSCAGHRATIVGTNGNNTIHGTRGNDVIDAKGGNDTIYGGGGNDIICGDGDHRVEGAGAVHIEAEIVIIRAGCLATGRRADIGQIALHEAGGSGGDDGIAAGAYA